MTRLKILADLDIKVMAELLNTIIKVSNRISGTENSAITEIRIQSWA